MPSAWQIRLAPATDWRTTDGIANLHLATDIPRPIPGPRTVLVRIKAAALNARDMMVVAHDPIYPIATIPDLSPCADGAGVVEEIGEGSVWKVGEKVLLNSCSWTGGDVPTLESSRGMGAGEVQGTLREYAIIDDKLLIRAPSNLSYEEMAALPAAAGTAVNALYFGPVPIKKGMTILTQGTGGVSCFAIQLAAAVGAIVIATSSSDTKLEIAKSLGATHLINYRKTPNWAAEVIRITNGRGVDHVVDVAGSGTIEQSLKATRHGGFVSLVGFLSESTKTDLVPEILFGAKTIRAIFQASVPMVEKVASLFEEHGLHPPIAKIYKWSQAKEAFAELVAQAAVGKIIIKVGDSQII